MPDRGGAPELAGRLLLLLGALSEDGLDERVLEDDRLKFVNRPGGGAAAFGGGPASFGTCLERAFIGGGWSDGGFGLLPTFFDAHA